MSSQNFFSEWPTQFLPVPTSIFLWIVERRRFFEFQLRRTLFDIGGRNLRVSRFGDFVSLPGSIVGFYPKVFGDPNESDDCQ